jgi:hypothetical protein
MPSRKPAFVRDELGRTLEITIRIARDGRVYFHDIPPDMIGVARAIDPGNPGLRMREQAARHFLSPPESSEPPVEQAR